MLCFRLVKEIHKGYLNGYCDHPMLLDFYTMVNGENLMTDLISHLVLNERNPVPPQLLKRSHMIMCANDQVKLSCSRENGLESVTQAAVEPTWAPVPIFLPSLDFGVVGFEVLDFFVPSNVPGYSLSRSIRKGFCKKRVVIRKTTPDRVFSQDREYKPKLVGRYFHQW